MRQVRPRRAASVSITSTAFRTIGEECVEHRYGLRFLGGDLLLALDAGFGCQEVIRAVVALIAKVRAHKRRRPIFYLNGRFPEPHPNRSGERAHVALVVRNYPAASGLAVRIVRANAEIQRRPHDLSPPTELIAQRLLNVGVLEISR